MLNDGTAGISHNGILRMNADGSERGVLLRDSVKSALAPSWSPRGDRIAFAFGRFFPAVLGSSSAAIAVMQADGSGVTLLTGSEDNAGFPSWAPDGRQLVYRVTNAGRSGLRIVNIGTRVVRTLTEPGDDNSPAWSPRGDRIAFTAKRGAADYDIFTVRVDGTDVRRLTTVARLSHSRMRFQLAKVRLTSSRPLASTT